MRGFVQNIEDMAKSNSDFRRVLYTAKHSQLVLMALNSGEEIGEEVHDSVDQILVFVEGEGVVSIEPEHYTRKTDAGENRWVRIEDYGRTLSGMRATCKAKLSYPRLGIPRPSSVVISAPCACDTGRMHDRTASPLMMMSAVLSSAESAQSLRTGPEDAQSAMHSPRV